MRISDWSSDVCSSDLLAVNRIAVDVGARSRAFIAVVIADDLHRPGWKRRFEVIHDELARRSEEHTSELQSLMRISYAVFCLKKKKRHSQRRIVKTTPNQATHKTASIAATLCTTVITGDEHQY